MKKIISILILLCLFVTVCSSCGNRKKAMYENALAFLEEGNYEEAKKLFENLGDYKDSEEYLSRFRYFAEEVNIENEHNIKISFNENNFPSQIVFSKEDGSSSVITLTYDQEGKLIQRSNLESDGEEIIFEYAYDQEGNLLKRTETTDAKIRTDNYTYDKNGNKISEISSFFSNGQETVHYFYYNYDKKGTLTDDMTIISAEKQTNDYIYDKDGKLIKQIYVLSQRPDFISQFCEVSRRTLDYIYDKNGNLIRIVNASDPRDSLLYDDYTYDENGNLIKQIHTDTKGNQTIYEYSYDEDGNQVQYTYTSYRGSQKNFSAIYDYTYDEAGNLIKEVFHNNINQYTNEYTYRLVYTPIAFPEEVNNLLDYLLDLIDPIDYVKDFKWYL